MTEEEIHAMIEEGQESGVIETAERDMVRNVFRLDDRQVASLMTPRSNISWIDLEAPDEENIELIRTSKRSRLPVCVGSLDNVKGVWLNQNASAADFGFGQTGLRQQSDAGFLCARVAYWDGASGAFP